MNRAQTAGYLSVSYTTVKKLTLAGKLPVVQVGMGRRATYRWRLGDLDNYVMKQMTARHAWTLEDEELPGIIAARILGIGKDTMYFYLTSGKVKSRKPEDLRDYLKFQVQTELKGESIKEVQAQLVEYRTLVSRLRTIIRETKCDCGRPRFRKDNGK